MKLLNVLSGMVLGGMAVFVVIAIVEIAGYIVKFIYTASGADVGKTIVTVLILLGIIGGGIVGWKVYE